MQRKLIILICIILRWCNYINYIMINTVLHTTLSYYLYGYSDYMFRHIRVILRSLRMLYVILNCNKSYLYLYIKMNMVKTLKCLTKYIYILLV
jgi:hypothetical protein